MTAIAALIIQGKLPKPDIAVIADTEREKRTTWEYLDSVINPNLKAIGLEVVRIKKSDFMTEDDPDVLTNWGSPGVTIPVFKKNEGGPEGRNPGLCSDRWKRRIVQRYVRSRGVEKCYVWLGMSTDEMRRVRVSDIAWYQNRYPLIFDFPMRRGECIRLVTDEMGWPEPPQSSCWMCPNHDDKHWLHLKTNQPDEFQKAVEFELEMQKHRADFYLHRSCIPLDQVIFETGQVNLFGCDTGYCFT